MVAFTCPDQEGAVAAVIVHEDALGLPASEVPVVPTAGLQAQQGACTLQYTVHTGYKHTLYSASVCVVGGHTQVTYCNQHSECKLYTVSNQFRVGFKGLVSYYRQLSWHIDFHLYKLESKCIAPPSRSQ